MESETQHPFSSAVQCSQQYQLGEKITCQFDITNQVTVDYYLLKWQTPLEGMKSPYLSVSKDGKPLTYHGMMVKRGNPQASDFVHIKAGESVSNSVDITTGYDFNEPGTYTIFLDASVQYQMTTPDSSQAGETKRQSLVSKEVTVEIIAHKI